LLPYTRACYIVYLTEKDKEEGRVDDLPLTLEGVDEEKASTTFPSR
jgi:hypothetical protein